jgi:predicted neutral ceramidase superfamily lipid hydrolase
MKKLFQKVAEYFKSTFTDRYYRELQQSWTGRAINAISFLMVIATLALWVTLFTLLRDRLTENQVAASVSTAVSCLAFFGGLVLAIFIGGWTGNLLRRVFWKVLVKLGK